MIESVINYLKENLTIEDYANLFQTYTEDRMAEAEESVFDLLDYKDFYLFADFYKNVDLALDCQKKARYWIAGMAFEKHAYRFPETIEACKLFMYNLIEDERILARKDLYSKFFDFKEEDYEPNTNAKHSLEYPVVLQWFTAFLFPILNNHPWNDWTYVEEIMDNISNMAYDFHLKYVKTEWNTTFMDYVAHFAYNNIHSYFECCYEEKDFDCIKKDIKNSPYWYDE